MYTNKSTSRKLRPSLPPYKALLVRSLELEVREALDLCKKSWQKTKLFDITIYNLQYDIDARSDGADASWSSTNLSCSLGLSCVGPGKSYVDQCLLSQMPGEDLPNKRGTALGYLPT